MASMRASAVENGAMSRRWETIWLVVATGACLMALPIGAVGAILSPMVFDPRSNLLNPAAWLAFLLTVPFWSVCIRGPFVAWIGHHRRMQQRKLLPAEPEHARADGGLPREDVPPGGSRGRISNY
jgi:hypothetical protein